MAELRRWRQIKLNSMFALRLDARDYVTTKPFDLIGKSGALHLIEASAGLGCTSKTVVGCQLSVVG